MSLETKIDLLTAAVQALTAQMGNTVTGVVELTVEKEEVEPVVKRKSKSKKSVEEKTPEPEKETVSDDDSTDETEESDEDDDLDLDDDEEELTLKIVRTKLMELNEHSGKAAVRAILKSVKAEKLPDIKEKDFQKVYDAAVKGLAA